MMMLMVSSSQVCVNFRVQVLTAMLIGRSFAVMPEGYYDLNDDLEKGHGGETLLALLTKRMEAGDQLA